MTTHMEGKTSRTRFLCLLLAAIVVAVLLPNPTLASPSSVNTLPATGLSASVATLNGEITGWGGPQFVAASAGSNFTMGVRSDGTLWAWGDNSNGQLGLGDTTGRNVPAQVGSAIDWVSVSAGYYHSLGVRSDGTLWAWGDNSNGQLGLGDITGRNVPTQVGSATDWVSVSAGYYHSFGMRSDGTLWAWGRNRATPPNDNGINGGQLGVGDITDRNVPTQVGSATNWVAVSGGICHSLGVLSDGTLWAWGFNPHGELGLGDIGQVTKTTPTRVVGAANWVAASGALYHSVGVCSDGTLWSWGMTTYAHSGSIWSPTRVGTDTNWVAVASKGNFSMGLRSDGTVWSWAHNADVIPSQVGSATNWAKLAAGSSHALGIRSDGTLWSWGSNSYGQLGLGDTTNRSSPTEMIQPCQVSFEWGPTTDYGNETAPQTMTRSGAFSAVIGGLTPGATYHFRARAVRDGTAYGSDMTFMAGTAPSVTTNNASSITTGAARLNGNLTSLGTANSVAVSFEWGTSSGSYSSESSGQAMTIGGAFYFDLADLDLGRTYYYRAKAVGHGEAAYGAEKMFATGLSPVVEGVHPGRGKRGQYLTIAISGANFNGVTSVSFGSGVAVESYDVISRTEITAEIAIDTDAEVGTRDVSVTNSTGTDTMTGGFAVTAGSSRLQWWVYPVAIVGGGMALMILVAVGARLVRRLVG